jgi:hypothetical protein
MRRSENECEHEKQGRNRERREVNEVKKDSY